ncbi:hypothetical protein Tco_0909068 [Tanacetum coccineum]|uniref:Uncharacterized protein n=1 Tax=Tanacetum coccineum TaxID=301880 RepID=A0ABQ5CPJ2_9ASTR
MEFVSGFYQVSQIPEASENDQDIHSINELQEEGEINDKKEQMGYEMNAPGKIGKWTLKRRPRSIVNQMMGVSRIVWERN